MNAIKDAIKSGRTVATVTPDIEVSIPAAVRIQNSSWEIKQLRPSIETMRDSRRRR